MTLGKESTQPEPSAGGPIKLFAIKVAIIVFAIFMVVSYIDIITQQNIADIRASVGHVGGRQFWTKLERALDDQADPKSDLTPEKKRKLLADIKAISDRWRPFIEEALANARETAPDISKR
jgi:hypothetical protein